MGKYIIEDKYICPWYKMEKEESIVVCNFPILGKYLNFREYTTHDASGVPWQPFSQKSWV